MNITAIPKQRCYALVPTKISCPPTREPQLIFYLKVCFWEVAHAPKNNPASIFTQVALIKINGLQKAIAKKKKKKELKQDSNKRGKKG